MKMLNSQSPTPERHQGAYEYTFELHIHAAAQQQPPSAIVPCARPRNLAAIRFDVWRDLISIKYISHRRKEPLFGNSVRFLPPSSRAFYSCACEVLFHRKCSLYDFRALCVAQSLSVANPLQLLLLLPTAIAPADIQPPPPPHAQDRIAPASLSDRSMRYGLSHTISSIRNLGQLHVMQ